MRKMEGRKMGEGGETEKEILMYEGGIVRGRRVGIKEERLSMGKWEEGVKERKRRGEKVIVETEEKETNRAKKELR